MLNGVRNHGRRVPSLCILIGWGMACQLASHAAPVNDQFANALPLSGTTLAAGSNVDATQETNEPLHAGLEGGKSVWWAWTATRDATVTVATTGSGFDTVLAVYSGASLKTLDELASNDDASLIETTSKLSFAATGGATYSIAVDGVVSDPDDPVADSGAIQLVVLDQDLFQDAQMLVGNDLIIETHNIDAATEPGEPAHAGQPASHSVWWTWTAPSNGALSLRLSGDNTTAQNTPFYKLLAVYTGNAVDQLSLVAQKGSTFSLTNQLRLDVQAGVPYRIVADGVANAAGRLQLELFFTPAPINDLFANKTPVEANTLPVLGSNVGASKEPGEPDHAGSAGGHSVWWTWTAPGNGNLGLTLSGGIPTTLLAVYTGNSVDALTPIRSRLSSNPNAILLEVMAGTEYHIAVDGLDGQVGDITLSVVFSPAVANDLFANRITFGGTNLILSTSNLGAGAEPGEPAHGGYPATRSVWWSWMAPGNGVVTVAVTGASLGVGGVPFYKLIGAYQGATVDSLVSVRQSSGLKVTNQITFSVLAGTTYHIAVDGYNGANGLFTLSLNYSGAPPNDNFAARIALAGDRVQTTGSNIAATKELGEPSHAGPGGRSVWWSWTAPGDGEAVISTAGSTFNTLLAVYRGATFAELLPVAGNNDYDGVTSQVTFNAVAGTTYQVAVDGLLEASGTIELTLSQEVVITPPDLMDPQFNGEFQFSFAGTIGAVYSIEGSTNLIHWTTLLIFTNTTGTVQFTDPDAALFPYGFYRSALLTE